MHLQNKNNFREATLTLQMLLLPPALLVGCVSGSALLFEFIYLL